jgi:hypothetical protein
MVNVTTYDKVIDDAQPKPAPKVEAGSVVIVPTNQATKSVNPADNSQDKERFSSALPEYYKQPDAAKDTGFQPVLIPRHLDKRSSGLSKVGANFNLSSFFSYYPMLRWGGYVGELTTSRASKLMERHLSELNSKISKMGTDKNKYVPEGGYEKYLLSREKKLDRISKAPDFVTPLAQAEAVGFTGLASAFAMKEYKDLKQNCALAVAAERGKDEKDIGFMDLRASNNPIVATAVDRFIWQTVARNGAGLSFFGGLLSGVLGNTALFTLERTVFYRPVAYDLLNKVVNDIQVNRLGDESKPVLVDGLIRSMQAMRMDHRQPLITKQQVDNLRPVLNRIAEDVIDRNFGLRGVMYLMGGGVLVPENPELSMRNYEHVYKLGVSGVAQEGKLIRAQTGAKASQTWQMALVAEREKDYVAESARENALLDQRDAIYSRGPLHAGAFREGMRGGDRSSSGVTI